MKQLPRFCYNCGSAVVAGRRACLRCNTVFVRDAVEPDVPDRLAARLPPNALEPGQRLAGRYLIETVESVRRLHVCYRAFDTDLERVVTLRTVRDSGRRGELRRQARVQCALDHRAIVRTLGFVHDRELDIVAIVEQHVGVRSLRDWLAESGTSMPSLAVLRDMLLPITSAVAHAHRYGVVHRNLKPGKVLLDRYDRPLVADFGLAGAELPKTQGFPAIVGTLEYLAPELADEPHRREPAGDIYALGVMFYEIISGHLPVSGSNDVEFLARLLKSPAVPLITVAPDVPIGLDAVVMRCLEKIPAERYGSADALGLALADVLGAT